MELPFTGLVCLHAFGTRLKKGIFTALRSSPEFRTEPAAKPLSLAPSQHAYTRLVFDSSLLSLPTNHLQGSPNFQCSQISIKRLTLLGFALQAAHCWCCDAHLLPSCLRPFTLKRLVCFGKLQNNSFQIYSREVNLSLPNRLPNCFDSMSRCYLEVRGYGENPTALSQKCAQS